MTDNTDNRTIAELAREALLIQDASNLMGLAHAFVKTMARLRALGEHDQRHPIIFMWVDKLSSLCGHQNCSGTEYSNNYDAVAKLAGQSNV